MRDEGAASSTPAAPSVTATAGRSLRVLMVLESDFRPYGGGGAESQLRTLASHLRRIGHQVSVVTPLLSRRPQATAERCEGIPVGRISYPHLPTIGALIMNARFAAFLLRHGRRYDAWHVHIGHHLGAITCLVGSLVGKPVVVKISGWWELEQGIMATGGKRRILNSVARSWLKRAGTIQAISTRIAAELSGQGFPADRILVLPNAVDTARFQAHRAPRAPDAPFTAVFVGRLVPEKGLATLLEAWTLAFREQREARGGRANVRLRLVGGGPEGPSLETQAKQLGIAGEVEFLGPSDRVEELLTEADVGVLPSRIEGLSNTLLEFMASGLPPLATRVSGSEDFVVPGRNGWLFPVSDVAALAGALREAAEAPPERLQAMGRQARADVASSASLDAVVGRLLALYAGARPGDLRKAG